jgi:8-oxo-dGTP pyrophosphatase MutT (NUDIX family)
MKMHLDSEDDFITFKGELRRRLGGRHARVIERDDLKHAAVMMLLMNKEGAPHVLLTLRSRHMPTHKGQVSFPGGGMDESDVDILSAAFRETEEEVGIGKDMIEYLGRFDDFISIEGFHVATFIGAIAYPYEWRLNSLEIESHFDAPLSMFVNREYDRCEKGEFMGEYRQVYFYHYMGYEIWGLTAGILTEFGEKVCGPEKRPERSSS